MQRWITRFRRRRRRAGSKRALTTAAGRLAALTWLRPTAFSRFSSAALCLRGKFQVTDPAAVEGLYLTVKYYGGLRVVLNGRENRPPAPARRPAGRGHARRDVPG